ncbi:hypothetical protein H9W95_11825 [Flavobacterium lindanitolerans]|nr:hypothetical protein [Flavobacterium lindanitolerans]
MLTEILVPSSSCGVAGTPVVGEGGGVGLSTGGVLGAGSGTFYLLCRRQKQKALSCQR